MDPRTQPPAAPRATLRPRDVLALTVGIIVGAGIFRTPSLVAGATDSAAILVAVWVAGGVLSMVGALCYAELASAWPSAGGDYHFLSRAYGERLAFLYAWARLAVIQTGSIALLAYVFADYCAAILPVGEHGPTLYAALAVVMVTAANRIGVRTGAVAQFWLTIAEVAGLVLVIVVGLSLSPAPVGPSPPASDSAIGLMLVFVLLTYGGWNEAVYVSAELDDAPRRMGPIMIGGLAIVTLLYVLANLAFLNALGLGGMAESDAVASAVMRRAGGEWGAAAISAIIAVAALTSANATAITGARTSYALGRRFALLDWLGQWDGARDTPGNALVAQGGVALVLVLAGAWARDGFQLAVDYTAPVFWLFLLLIGVALIVLRWREPDRPRPFRVPLYPLTPLLFCATTGYLLWSSIAYTGVGALVGVGVLGIGAAALAFLNPLPPVKEADP